MGPSFLYGRKLPVRVCVVNDRRMAMVYRHPGWTGRSWVRRAGCWFRVLFLCLLGAWREAVGGAGIQVPEALSAERES